MNRSISAMGCVLLNYCEVTDVMLVQRNNKNIFLVLRSAFYAQCALKPVANGQCGISIYFQLS